MTEDVYIYSGLFSFIANLLIGIFVFSKNHKKPINIYFSLFSLTVSGWSVGSFLINVIPDEHLALSILRFNYLFAVWLPTIFRLFIYSATETPFTQKKFLLTISTVFSTVLSVAVFTPWFIPNLQMIESTNFRISFPGPIYYFFFAFFAITMLETLLYIGFQSKRFTGIQSTQLKYITISNAIAVFGGFEYFSRVFGFFKSPPIDDYLLVLYLLIIAYSIIRHRLIDIEVFVKRTLIFSLFLGLAMAIVSLATASGINFLGQFFQSNQTSGLMEFFGDYRFLTVSGYITGILCIGLAFLVLRSNPKSRNCQLTAGFNLFTGLWSIFYGTMYIAGNGSLGILDGQFLNASAVPLNTFLSHLVIRMAKKEKVLKNFITLNYLFAILIMILMFIPKVMVAGCPPKLDLPAYTEPGPLYFLLPLYLFANFFYSLIELFRLYKKAQGHFKNQIKLFLFAITAGYLMGTPTFLLVYDIPVKPIMTPLVSLLPLILTYTIIRHQFLDIKKLVKNTLLFSLLFIALLGFVSIVLFIFKEGVSRQIGISDYLSQAIAIGLAISLYGPLKRGLSKFTNRLLYQHVQNPEFIFSKLSEDIIHYLDAKKLADEATNRIAQILGLESISFYTRSKLNRSIFEITSSIGKINQKYLSQSEYLIQYLEDSETPLVQIQTDSEASNQLLQLGGVAAFPIFVKNNLHTILIIGSKKSDVSWSEEEFHILKSFMRHLALALANSEYADEIQHSREKLSLSERDASAGALIAGVDHEVKNPIHTISLQLGTLTSNLSNPLFLAEPKIKIEETVQKIMTNIRSGILEINSVIEHLSDLADKKPLIIENHVNPYQITEKVVSDFRQNTCSKHIFIDLKIPKELSIACDSNALYEILNNLIQNAEQAISDEGKITIKGRSEHDHVVIEVTDTGIGISKDRLTKIFEPFFTTKKNKHGHSGTGMGLFICQEYMQSMGAKIDVSSELGKGTKFSLQFPAKELTRKAL